MTTLSIKIPETLKLQLSAEAERRGTSCSGLIRRLLEKTLQYRSPYKGPSCYEFMSEACGIIKNGPHDLSYNKEHMKGFGK